MADGPLERLPRIGVGGLASELQPPVDDIECAVHAAALARPAPGRADGRPRRRHLRHARLRGLAPARPVARRAGRRRAAAHRDPSRLRTHDPLAPARPTRSTCAAACRKRAGCSRAWRRAATRCCKVMRCLLRAAVGLPRIRRPGAAPADAARSRRRSRPARIDDLARDRAQVRAHAARHHSPARTSSPPASTPTAAARPPAPPSRR